MSRRNPHECRTISPKKKTKKKTASAQSDSFNKYEVCNMVVTTTSWKTCVCVEGRQQDRHQWFSLHVCRQQRPQSITSLSPNQQSREHSQVILTQLEKEK